MGQFLMLTSVDVVEDKALSWLPERGISSFTFYP
jgi:hypothetical protein